MSEVPLYLDVPDHDVGVEGPRDDSPRVGRPRQARDFGLHRTISISMIKVNV